MANLVQINQLGIATVYGPANKNQVNQAGVVIAYKSNPEVRIAQAGLTVVYSDRATEGKIQVNATGITMVYTTFLHPKRKFPIPNPETRWSSQPGKRKFPVVS
jgi:hypothetical protein